MVDADPWSTLAAHTPARIARGRAGAALPNREVLALALAHAQARDAVHLPFDTGKAANDIAAQGFETVQVSSAAMNRTLYLQRPDLGRRLCEHSVARLRPSNADVVFVVADGLSSAAAHTHAAPLLAALKAPVAKAGWSVGPVVIACQSRVALGDEIGELLRARLLVMLIGERPGLSSPDSLGAYLTFRPKVGRSDADRNCVSNIRPAGLPYDRAAFKLVWLMRQALRLSLTGVALKDESDLMSLNVGAAAQVGKS